MVALNGDVGTPSPRSELPDGKPGLPDLIPAMPFLPQLELRNFTRQQSVPRWIALLAALAFLSWISGIAGCGSSEEMEPEIEDTGVATARKVDLTVIELKSEGDHRMLFETSDGAHVSWCLSVPPERTDQTKAPLILFLHPPTPTGSWSAYYAWDFLQQLIKPAFDQQGAYIIAPDCRLNSFANEESVDEIMELVLKFCETYPVDRSRTAVIGYSMGGQGAWYFARERPDFFRAAIAMAGRPPDQFGAVALPVPVRSIHSRRDEIFLYDQTVSAINALKDAGSEVELVTIEEASHFEIMKYKEPLTQASEWLKSIWDRNP